ncbi:MAG: hypothetical protein WKF71_15165 [Pyrinomonadaceae bacterium]
MREFQASAQRLLNLLAYRMHKPERRKVSSRKIVERGRQSRISSNDLTDYVWLLDSHRK